MNNNLAYVGKVTAVDPIPGAEPIESLEVACGSGGKWRGTAVKGQFAVGDLCEVYLQDALLPQIERFAFMEKHNWRVRMMRLRGAPSECLIMPLTVLPDVGTSIDELIGVTKYTKVLPPHIGGDIKGPLPWFVPKTDEVHFQKVPHLVEALHGEPWYATIKYDGSSGTAYWYEGELHCCSRNYELKDTPNSAIWQLARKYNLAGKLRNTAIAIQFEIVGPSIQGNPLRLKEVDMRVFDAYLFNGGYSNFTVLCTVSRELEIPMVRVCADGNDFDLSEKDLRDLAESARYDNDKPAEGIVVRSKYAMANERISFKVINLKYKDS
jgi:RNA ligase (TIGR02306 family)